MSAIMAIRRSVFAVCLVFILCLSGFAQNITGSITGVVKDPSGAVVSGATVTITNTDTGLVARTVSTDASGVYSAPLLPIGHYSISAASSGFSTATITAIELHVNDQLKYDLTVNPAATGQSITVEANAVQVETQSATAAGLINGTQIRELAMNNRNYEQLVGLQPGVVYGGNTDQIYIGGASVPGGTANTVSFSINGQRNSANNWMVDGADNVDRGSNLTLLNYPSVDAIAEFKVLRGLYNPEFGRDAGGMINVVTKSGTDKFHGDAYEFFRNDVLNANTYFNKLAHPIVPRSKLRYNDFGYTIGGPVKIPGLYTPDVNKTFFFFSEEFRRVLNYSTLSAIVPTAAERAGTFASPVCVSYNASTASCSSVGTQVTNINPVAQAYLKDIFSKVPLPNGGPGLDPHTLLSPVNNIYNARQELVRIDHNVSEKLALAFRFINDSIPTQEPGGLFTGDQIPGVATTNTNAPGKDYLGRFTATFSPTLLLDGGYAFSYGAIISDPIGLIAKTNSPDINPTLAFASTLARIPAVAWTNGSSVTGYGPYRDFNRDHQVFMNLSKIMGNHSLKFGGIYHHYQKTENASGNNVGTFTFDTTGDPNPGTSSCKTNPSQPACATTTYNQAFANFLSGYVGTFTQASTDLTPDVRMNQVEWYAQDEWKARRNVTVTYGVRWSWFQQPYDAKDELTNFVPSLYNPANAPVFGASGANVGLIVTPGANPLNGIAINNQNSPWGSRVGPSPLTNFAPRLGLAWDPTGSGKTSIRTGYGMTYDSSLVGVYEQNIFANPPFVQSVTLTGAPFDNVTSGTPKISAAPLALHGTPFTNALPYVQQWSLDVQQQLPMDMILDVGYYGNKGTHLLGEVDLNQPRPGAFATAGLVDRSGNPINPTACAAGLAQPTPTSKYCLQSSNEYVLESIRPYKGYDAINTIQPWFNSNYNSLQVALQKRFHGGSLINVDYTWSHALTDNQTDRSTAVEDLYCIHCEYGPSQLDRRQVLSANYVYEIPWLHEQHGFVGHVFGGWELSGIVAANSGLPLTVTTSSAFDPAGLGVKDASSAAGPRPDIIGDPNQNAPHEFLDWFNTSAFTDVPASAVRIGTSPRGTVTGPGFWRIDQSVFKNFVIHEDVRLQFRAEAFNLLNHTNYTTVNTTLGSAAFGQITGTRDPRIMQLALKLYF